jgi:hypothetical protein
VAPSSSRIACQPEAIGDQPAGHAGLRPVITAIQDQGSPKAE